MYITGGLHERLLVVRQDLHAALQETALHVERSNLMLRFYTFSEVRILCIVSVLRKLICVLYLPVNIHRRRGNKV